MCHGLGRIQSRVLEFANKKATSTDPIKYRTVLPYVRSDEVAKALGIEVKHACRALVTLRERSLLRLYPNKRLRGKYYGALMLPEISEIPSFRALLSGNKAFTRSGIPT